MKTFKVCVIIFILLLIFGCTNDSGNNSNNDTTPPTIILISHTDNQKLTDSVATIQVSVTDESSIDSVLIDNKLALLNGDKYEVILTLSRGNNTLNVIASDVHANKDTLIFHLFFGPVIFINTYTGTLYLQFTNDFPSFDETGSVSVTVDEYGLMTFGTGTLPYSGEDDNGQLKINRNGTLTMNPNGQYIGDSTNGYFAVNENTDLDETLKTWIWNGTTWQSVLDQNITNTFNEGLVFDINEAIISGSIVEVNVPDAGSAKWTLVLAVDP